MPPAAKTLLDAMQICLDKLDDGIECDMDKLRKLEASTLAHTIDAELSEKFSDLRTKLHAKQNEVSHFWDTSVSFCDQLLRDDLEPIELFCEQSTLLTSYMFRDLSLESRCRKYFEFYHKKVSNVSRRLLRAIASSNKANRSISDEPADFFDTLRTSRDEIKLNCTVESAAYLTSSYALDAHEDLAMCVELQLE